MKSRFVYMLAFLALPLIQGCTKVSNDVSSFTVKFDGFIDADGGEKLEIPNASFQKFLFTDGDEFYVNNYKFTIAQSGSDWVATSSTNIEADEFNCIYFDPINCSKSAYGAGSYSVDFITSNGMVNGLNTYLTGPVFAGQTTDHVITMKPCFAIIKFIASNINNLKGIYVGFDDNKVVKTASVQGQPGTTKPTLSGDNLNYFTGVSKGVDVMFGGEVLNGDMIKATRNYVASGVANNQAYYCVVPLAADGITTNIYVMGVNNSDVAAYHKVSSKTLNRGYVYTLRW